MFIKQKMFRFHPGNAGYPQLVLTNNNFMKESKFNINSYSVDHFSSLSGFDEWTK